MKKVILAGIVLVAIACNQSKVATDFYQRAPLARQLAPAPHPVTFCSGGDLRAGYLKGKCVASEALRSRGQAGIGYGAGYGGASDVPYFLKGAAAAPQNPASDFTVTSKHADVQEQMLIKKACLRLEVKNFLTAKSRLSAIIKGCNAYISSERESKSESDVTNAMTIRVPQPGFDRLVDSIVGLAKNLDEKNINVEDVTEEYVDTESRLKAKRSVEERYLEILKKAQTIKDILAVEENLGEIREAIESAEGRLKYLSHQVNYGTVDLTFYEHKNMVPAVRRTGLLWQTFTAFVEGWNGLLDFSLGLVSIWPGLIVIALIIAVIIRIFRKWKKRNEKED